MSGENSYKIIKIVLANKGYSNRQMQNCKLICNKQKLFELSERNSEILPTLNQMTLRLKGPYLGSNLFLDKASHEIIYANFIFK